MALTHTHRIVLQDYAGNDMRSNHLSDDGEDFGHDEHVALVKRRGDDSRASWEHTHEGVEERYDEVQDNISLHRLDPEADAPVLDPHPSTTQKESLSQTPPIVKTEGATVS